MLQRRFYCETRISGPTARLVGAEATHLTRVLRARIGDRVTLFDGSGDEFTATVVRLNRQEVELRVDARLTVDRELPVPLHIGVALPKGERQKWMVEKAVELGVTSLTLLSAARGVVEPGDQATRRLERYVIEASKQCGRNRLMRIGHACDLATFCGQAPADATRYIAHPHSTSPTDPHGSTAPRCPPRGECWFAIGPEGGWTEAELDQARSAGWQFLDLGPRILRVETAVCFVAVMATIGHLS